MKSKSILFVLFIAVGFTNCKKPADIIQGVYNGTTYINASDAGSSTTSISMISDNVVSMHFVITGDTVIDYDNVAVAGVENPYSLSCHLGNGNMYGQVSGNNLNFTFYDTSGTQINFIGSK